MEKLIEHAHIENVELEVRFGELKKGVFMPGVKKAHFEKIEKAISGKFKCIARHTLTDYIHGPIRVCNGKAIHKKRVWKLDEPKMRWCVSVETPVDLPTTPSNFIRVKERVSYFLNGVQLDFTQVSGNYEVELELKETHNEAVKLAMDIIRRVLITISGK